MGRAARAAALLSLLSLGCGGNGKAAEPAKSEPAQREPGAAIDPSEPRAALAGSWSGATTIAGYGTVVASFSLDREGKGYYFVTASGQKRQGSFKLLRWDKNYLFLEAEGHQERVHATHRGDELWIDHALVGQVKLVRER